MLWEFNSHQGINLGISCVELTFTLTMVGELNENGKYKSLLLGKMPLISTQRNLPISIPLDPQLNPKFFLLATILKRGKSPDYAIINKNVNILSHGRVVSSEICPNILSQRVSSVSESFTLFSVLKSK